MADVVASLDVSRIPVRVSAGADLAGFEGYDDVVDHEANFFESVRSRKRVVENEEFGNNAALGCHLANYAYFKRTAAVWDPASRQIKG